MTEQSFDPLALWRDMLSKWETGVNDLANKNMGSPEFSRFMNQAMGMSVRMQHTMGEMMGKYLTAMNMPSRNDLIAIGERLQSIEDQVARLTAVMEQRAPARPSVEAKSYAGPPRTRRPHALSNGPAPVAVAAHADIPAMPAAAAKPARRAAKKKKSKAS